MPAQSVSRRVAHANGPFIAKTVMVGARGVGKSSLLRWFPVNNCLKEEPPLPPPSSVAAVGAAAVSSSSSATAAALHPDVPFQEQHVQVDGYAVRLHIWDTMISTSALLADSIRRFPSAYYHGADAVVVVYSVARRSSFDSVRVCASAACVLRATRRVQVLAPLDPLTQHTYIHSHTHTTRAYSHTHKHAREPPTSARA